MFKHNDAHSVKPPFQLPKLTELTATLFFEDAQAIANCLEVQGAKQDKYTQLRRFYDEVCRYHEEIGDVQATYDNKIAFFKMLASQATYAKGRDLISVNCHEWLMHCIKQVNSPVVLKHFKYHFEAVLGFVKERNKS